MFGYKRSNSWSFILLLIFLASTLYAKSEWPYKDALKDDIQFWKLVFAHYNQNQHIIHDAKKLNIIYKVISFDSTVSKASREEQIESTKENIEKTLNSLAESKNKDHTYSNFELYILNLFGDSTTSADFREAADQIRAQQGMRDRFVEGMKRSLYYLPFLKEVFRGYELPEELAYLPHIESSFNPFARSRVGASGMWQFMRATARLYMKVNRIIDQRLDPLVSTRAAAQLLKNSYDEIGDWALAITSYNYGLSGMKRAAEKYDSDYLAVRSSFKSRRFRFASRNFYPEFLAIVEIMNEADQLFPQMKATPAPEYIPLQLSKYVNLPKLSKKLELDLETLKKVNPVYTRRAWRGWVNVPKGYWFNLPIDKNLTNVDRYFQNIQLAVAEPPELSEVDSLEEDSSPLLAKASESASSELTFNLPNEINWRKTEIESKAASTQKKFQTEMVIDDNQNMLHYRELTNQLKGRLVPIENHIEVFVNETLGHYADWLGIATQRLRNLNGLPYGESIFQGQKLKMDFSRVSKKEFQEKRIQYHLSTLSSLFKEKKFVRFKKYEVNAGESLWHLARSRYKVPIEMIQYLNFHEDVNRLYPGDIVRIPIYNTENSMEETL